MITVNGERSGFDPDPSGNIFREVYRTVRGSATDVITAYLKRLIELGLIPSIYWASIDDTTTLGRLHKSAVAQYLRWVPGLAALPVIDIRAVVSAVWGVTTRSYLSSGMDDLTPFIKVLTPPRGEKSAFKMDMSPLEASMRQQLGVAIPVWRTPTINAQLPTAERSELEKRIQYVSGVYHAVGQRDFNIRAQDDLAYIVDMLKIGVRTRTDLLVSEVLKDCEDLLKMSLKAFPKAEKLFPVYYVDRMAKEIHAHTMTPWSMCYNINQALDDGTYDQEGFVKVCSNFKIEQTHDALRGVISESIAAADTFQHGIREFDVSCESVLVSTGILSTTVDDRWRLVGAVGDVMSYATRAAHMIRLAFTLLGASIILAYAQGEETDLKAWEDVLKMCESTETVQPGLLYPSQFVSWVDGIVERAEKAVILPTNRTRVPLIAAYSSSGPDPANAIVGAARVVFPDAPPVIFDTLEQFIESLPVGESWTYRTALEMLQHGGGAVLRIGLSAAQSLGPVASGLVAVGIAGTLLNTMTTRTEYLIPANLIPDVFERLEEHTELNRLQNEAITLVSHYEYNVRTTLEQLPPGDSPNERRLDRRLMRQLGAIERDYQRDMARLTQRVEAINERWNGFVDFLENAAIAHLNGNPRSDRYRPRIGNGSSESGGGGGASNPNWGNTLRRRRSQIPRRRPSSIRRRSPRSRLPRPIRGDDWASGEGGSELPPDDDSKVDVEDEDDQPPLSDDERNEGSNAPGGNSTSDPVPVDPHVPVATDTFFGWLTQVAADALWRRNWWRRRGGGDGGGDGGDGSGDGAGSGGGSGSDGSDGDGPDGDNPESKDDGDKDDDDKKGGWGVPSFPFPFGWGGGGGGGGGSGGKDCTCNQNVYVNVNVGDSDSSDSEAMSQEYAMRIVAKTTKKSRK